MIKNVELIHIMIVSFGNVVVINFQVIKYVKLYLEVELLINSYSCTISKKLKLTLSGDNFQRIKLQNKLQIHNN